MKNPVAGGSALLSSQGLQQVEACVADVFCGEALCLFTVALPDGLQHRLVLGKGLLGAARGGNGLAAGALDVVMEGVQHVLQGPAF